MMTALACSLSGTFWEMSSALLRFAAELWLLVSFLFDAFLLELVMAAGLEFELTESLRLLRCLPVCDLLISVK